jgi:hypothetical protein
MLYRWYLCNEYNKFNAVVEKIKALMFTQDKPEFERAREKYMAYS